MKLKPSIYLDTSTINFLFAEDAPEKMEITIDLFDNFIKKGIYATFISNFVIQEILQTKDKKKQNQLLSVIDKYYIQILKPQNLLEIEELASMYVQGGVVPAKKIFDALHISVAVTQRMDYLVSWNYKHLANVNREKKVMLINTENNYLHPIRILTPLELIDYEN